jgi:EAL domain-containing protein (putative c-di-GMP-specific phosphodiesterase class I)/CheY-like chemotaxis protein
VLKEAASRLMEQVRAGDSVARIGGDEFVVLLPDLAQGDDVLPVVERILLTLAKPYQIDGALFQTSASIGITLSDGNVERPMDLIQQADIAMYKAKQEGRNNYQWFTNDLSQSILERVDLRRELQQAIENQDFELYYQPQIDSRNGMVVGMEALIRWNHAVKGFISPIKFISVAEETGQIVPLSLWIFETACRHIRLLADQGMSKLSVAVNVSPIHFRRKDFLENIVTVLTRNKVNPEQLELEITESVLLKDTEQTIETFHKLKLLGIRIALDDFGTGYSSLSYLKRLPLNKVKIDRSFIMDIVSNSDDAAITKGIISMAHHLRMKVIAEGVENEFQCAFLRKANCDVFQGYYFARPMPFAELQIFLRERMLTWVPDLLPIKDNEYQQTLLLLDDEENILRALTRVLRRDGYKVLMATRAQDAFELLAKHDVQVIISDQRMPEMNGTEFFRRVKAMYPKTIRIVLSGYTDLNSVTEAINEGAIYKFLTKPWDDEQLRRVVAEGFKASKADLPYVS